MAGLFSRISGDPQKRANSEAAKRVRRLAREKRYGEALDAGLEYLKQVPHNQDVLFVVGAIYFRQEDYARALEYLGRAGEIGEYDPDVLLLKARAHHARGEGAAAAACCKKLLEVDPKNSDARQLLGSLDV